MNVVNVGSFKRGALHPVISVAICFFSFGGIRALAEASAAIRIPIPSSSLPSGRLNVNQHQPRADSIRNDRGLGSTLHWAVVSYFVLWSSCFHRLSFVFRLPWERIPFRWRDSFWILLFQCLLIWGNDVTYLICSAAFSARCEACVCLSAKVEGRAGTFCMPPLVFLVATLRNLLS